METATPSKGIREQYQRIYAKGYAAGRRAERKRIFEQEQPQPRVGIFKRLFA